MQIILICLCFTIVVESFHTFIMYSQCQVYNVITSASSKYPHLSLTALVNDFKSLSTLVNILLMHVLLSRKTVDNFGKLLKASPFMNLILLLSKSKNISFL